MKNADMPAMPTEFYREAPTHGLTKREEAAFRAMQGLLAGVYSQCSKHHLDELPKEAVDIADALLAELEKK